MSVFQKEMFQRVVRESRDRVKTYCGFHRTLGGSNFQDRYAPQVVRLRPCQCLLVNPHAKIFSEFVPTLQLGIN